jgi:hypothetical protein
MENARSAFDLRLEPVGGRLVIETPIGSFHRPDMPVERGAPIDGIARMSPLDSTAWTCPRGVEIRECSRSSHPQPVSKCPLDPSANRIGGHAMHSYCSTHGFESAAYRGGRSYDDHLPTADTLSDDYLSGAASASSLTLTLAGHAAV